MNFDGAVLAGERTALAAGSGAAAGRAAGGHCGAGHLGEIGLHRLEQLGRGGVAADREVELLLDRRCCWRLPGFAHGTEHGLEDRRTAASIVGVLGGWCRRSGQAAMQMLSAEWRPFSLAASAGRARWQLGRAAARLLR